MKPWFSESMTHWTGDSVNQWNNEPMRGWTGESMNQWTNEWRDGWMNEWMGAFLCWATSSVSDLFAEAPLLSATSFLIEQPLIWATSALSCLPASSFVASEPNSSRRAAVPMRLATSMQPQSRLPGASQQHWTLCCAQPCQCVLSQSVANLHAGALQIEQRSHSADNGNDSALLRELRL